MIPIARNIDAELVALKRRLRLAERRIESRLAGPKGAKLGKRKPADRKGKRPAS